MGEKLRIFLPPWHFAFVFLAAWATQSLDARAADKVLFQFSWIPVGDYAPISAGIAKGFFSDVGIDLDVATGRGSSDTITRLVGGAALFGEGDMSAVMTARVSNGVPVKCIMSQHSYSPHSMFVLESSGITQLSQLAGKKIGTTPGNSHFLYFPIVAKQAGLDPDSVTWVTTDSNTMVSLLISKKVDAIPLYTTNWYYVNKQVKAAIGDQVRVIPFADYGFKIYAYCISALESTLKNKPNLVRRFLSALKRSYEWARTHEKEAIEFHVKKFPEVAADDALGSLQAMDQNYFASDRVGPFGCFDHAQLQNTYKVVAESQKLDPAADVEQFVDTSFLDDCPH